MRKIMAVLMLSAMSSHVMAGWSEFAADNVATEYVNLATISKADNHVKMWNMSDYKVVQDVGDGTLYQSSKAQQEYDCKTPRKRLVSLIHYSQNKGAGKVVYADSVIDEWRPVVAGSLGEVQWKLACKSTD